MLLAWILTIDSVVVGTQNRTIKFTIRDEARAIRMQQTLNFPLSIQDEAIIEQLKIITEAAMKTPSARVLKKGYAIIVK